MGRQFDAFHGIYKDRTMSKQDEFERLVEYIHSAIEAEQLEPVEFKTETELRLRLVYSALRKALGLPEIEN